MALVVARRLCSSSSGIRLLPKLIHPYPYPCYFCTNLDFKHDRTIFHPIKYMASNTSNHSSYRALRKYSTNSKETEKDSDKKEECEKEQKLSIFQKFKQMYRDYWYVLVPVHIVTSVAWFGGFYYLASSGVDIPVLLEWMNFNEKIVNSMRNSSMGYYAITYALYKIATPARYAVTLGGTTISIQYLKKCGYIKPLPSKEQLRKIYEDTKEGISEGMKEKRENILESVQNLKETVKETKEGIKDKKDNLVSSVKDSKESIKNKVMGSTSTNSNKGSKSFNPSHKS